MKEVAFILYSHTDYGDLWEAFFGQTEELLPNSFPKYMFVNREIFTDRAINEKFFKIIPEDYTIIFHDKEKYSDRIASCLEHIKEEYCIFQHEDMMLYEKPDMEKLERYLQVLKDNQELDFVKLLKGGDVDDEPYGLHKDLFLAKEWLLAIQPAIWKIPTLKKIFNHFKEKGIWELEKEAQDECRALGVKGVYCFNGERQRGRLHWDSKAYPYIATAINKGRWNTAEYSSELEDIFREYDIDRMKRGFIA